MGPKQQPIGDGLRARVRKRKAAADSHVEFGVAQANAYFNARHIKRAARKPQVKRSAQSSNNNSGANNSNTRAQHEDDVDGAQEQPSALVLPAHALTLAALRTADEREAARRALVPEHALPTFEQNLLFYGVGSKLELLQRFAEQFLDDGVVLQLHGYLPTVSMRYLTKFLHNEILRVHVKASRSVVQQCQDIVKIAEKEPHKPLPRVYLVVHSIDGMAMRSPETQTCLSWLGTAPFVHIVASIDQINGTSLWREEDSLRFQWISQSVNTCLPYSDELELRLTKQSKTTDQSSSGVKFILQSLTPTDVATLRIIAQHQLAASASASSSARRKPGAAVPPADYQKVYEVCRKRLLHLTLLAMKNSVKCLEEHGLVKLLRVRNIEKLEIPLPEHLVKTEILQMTDAVVAQDGPQAPQY
ncbi:hypothetical protein PybrP1_010405 [[Pythium] brassicae (nom. inval.)]|nr:hypothetical protein PybrP1_010405 [[Pythium] brassicae (nom. inval.)]